MEQSRQKLIDELASRGCEIISNGLFSKLKYDKEITISFNLDGRYDLPYLTSLKDQLDLLQRSHRSAEVLSKGERRVVTKENIANLTQIELHQLVENENIASSSRFDACTLYHERVMKQEQKTIVIDILFDAIGNKDEFKQLLHNHKTTNPLDHALSCDYNHEKALEVVKYSMEILRSEQE